MSDDWALFLGPDKAGSTWIYEYGRAHPDVVTASSKELFFFDRYYGRGWSWYRSRFPARRGVRLDVSHDYLFSPQAARRVARDLPTARLIVCLRDPIDRLISSYLYQRRQGRIRTDLPTALRTVDELVDHGLYAKHLGAWIAECGRDRIRILDFSLLSRDVLRFGETVAAALGVDPIVPLPAELREPVRAAATARHAGTARLARRVALTMRQLRLEAALDRLKRSHIVERALFRPLGPGERVALEPELRTELTRVFGPDARQLDDRFGTEFARQWNLV